MALAVTGWLTLREPTTQELADLARGGEDQAWTYPCPGASRDPAASPWTVRARRRCIGTGRELWSAAADALDAWAMFEIPWLKLSAPSAPEPGALLAFASHQMPLWTVQVCRVVYREREEPSDDGALWTMAYGTLTPHPLRGEEAFRAEWHRDTDEVWLEVSELSRESHPALRIARPFTRRAQDRFTRHTLAAIAAKVAP